MKYGPALLLLLLAACEHISVRYSALNPAPHPTQVIDSSKVEVFTTALPPRPYVEIGNMRAMHDSVSSNEEMFNAMKIEAATRGCDALVVTQQDTVVAVAACIVYK